NALKSFQWRDHLPYNKSFSVTQQGNKIYAVANESIFSYNKEDNTYQKLSKVNGLSDIEPSIVKNNPYNNALVIAYKNSNIDIIKNGGTTNVSDLLQKQNFGNKIINNITFSGKLAYLACGFGIAVFDTDALEFNDTYIIGPGGTNLNVYEVAITQTTLYAATNKGIYTASLNSSNLASYTNWNLVTTLPAPNGTYNGVVSFGGNVLASYSGALSPNPPPGVIDTLYKFDGTNWTKFPFNTGPDLISKIIVSDDKKQFILVDNVGFKAYDSLGNNLITAQSDLQGFNGQQYHVSDVMPDLTNTGWYWEANSSVGLLRFKNLTDKPQLYQINGPLTNTGAQIQIKDDKVIVAPVSLGYQSRYTEYLQSGVFSFDNDTWTSKPRPPLFDIGCVAFDYNDKTHYYAGSFGAGMAEIKDDSTVAVYTRANSPIPYRHYDSQNQVTSLFSDINNNLWIASNDTCSFLTVKKPDNTWASLNFSYLIGGVPDIHINQVLVDSSNQAWVATFGSGVFLYKNDGNFSQPNASNSKQLINATNKGGLPTNNTICLALDKNNDIWVGTDQGVYVFYSPNSILTEANGWDAQPIYVQQDGQTQLLLATDAVTSIFVDGANNKWIGTAISGLFCFSPDGQTQLYHFTIDNSPLFSNSIINVNVNGKTGEVFILTDKGIQSFQNTTEEGHTTFEDVYAYPNPVKPGYTGPILIHGMISGATVKIVDAGGNFVYETTSEGGQATWNGENFKGVKVTSG
ncbi:MAG: two-component regulator propeller domain-containing protein, partial [Bacteroidia bacterium]